MITQRSANSWTPHRYYIYALKHVAKKHWFWVPLPRKKNVKIFHSCDNQLTGQIPNFAQTIKKGTFVSAQDWSLAFTGVHLQTLSSVQNLKHEIPMHLKYIYSKGRTLLNLVFKLSLGYSNSKRRTSQWNLGASVVTQGKGMKSFTLLNITHCDFKRKRKSAVFSFFFPPLSMLFQEDKANSSTLTQFWSSGITFY